MQSVNARSGTTNLHVRNHGRIVQTKFGQQEPSQCDFNYYHTGGSGLPTSGLHHFEIAQITPGTGSSAYFQLAHARHTNRQYAASQGGLAMITDTYEMVGLTPAVSALLLN